MQRNKVRTDKERAFSQLSLENKIFFIEGIVNILDFYGPLTGDELKEKFKSHYVDKYEEFMYLFSVAIKISINLNLIKQDYSEYNIFKLQEDLSLHDSNFRLFSPSNWSRGFDL